MWRLESISLLPFLPEVVDGVSGKSSEELWWRVLAFELRPLFGCFEKALIEKTSGLILKGGGSLPRWKIRQGRCSEASGKMKEGCVGGRQLRFACHA